MYEPSTSNKRFGPVLAVNVSPFYIHPFGMLEVIVIYIYIYFGWEPDVSHRSFSLGIQ